MEGNTYVLSLSCTVIENFELSEGRSPGDISTSDLPVVLKLRKESCDTQVT